MNIGPGSFCTDLTAFGPYCHDFGPIFPCTAPRSVSKRSVILQVVPYFDEPVGRVKIQTTSPLEYKYRVIFVLVLGVICTLRSAVEYNKSVIF